MKHSVFAKIVTLALTLVLVLSLAACGKKSDSGVKILVPNDTTNEARALLLLQENGIITLKDGAGITATKNDIVDNPYNVEIVEAEAALPAGGCRVRRHQQQLRHQRRPEPREGLPAHRGLRLRLCQHSGCEGGYREHRCR